VVVVVATVVEVGADFVVDVVVVDPDGPVVVVVVVAGRDVEVVEVVVGFAGPPGREVVVVVAGRVVVVVVGVGMNRPGTPPVLVAGVVEDAAGSGG